MTTSDDPPFDGPDEKLAGDVVPPTSEAIAVVSAVDAVGDRFPPGTVVALSPLKFHSAIKSACNFGDGRNAKSPNNKIFFMGSSKSTGLKTR
jgi:hypothetical protein